jgi:hypothetical protein
MQILWWLRTLQVLWLVMWLLISIKSELIVVIRSKLERHHLCFISLCAWYASCCHDFHSFSIISSFLHSLHHLLITLYVHCEMLVLVVIKVICSTLYWVIDACELSLLGLWNVWDEGALLHVLLILIVILWLISLLCHWLSFLIEFIKSISTL